MANDDKVQKITTANKDSDDAVIIEKEPLQSSGSKWSVFGKRASEFDTLSKLELEELAGDAVPITTWHQVWDMHTMWANRKKIMFPPSSSVLFVGTALFYVMIMYNWFAILYRISFAMHLDVGERAIFILVDLIVDIMSIAECFVSARSGFLHQGTLVSNLSLLWRHYSRKWLIMDIVSLFPIHFVGFGFDDNVYAWLRIMRLVRIARWNEYWGLWGGHARNANLVRLIKIIVIFFMIIHIFGSTYFYIVYHEGYGVNNWVAKDFREDDPGISRYLFGLFWAGSFMTGSNYAEPRTAIELYFSLIMMLVGVLIFAAVIANIGGIFSQLNRVEGKYRTKMSQLDAFMRYRQLGRPLQTKIRNYYEYMWSRQQGLNDEDILRELPSHLHTQVALDLTQDLIKKVPFFQGCPEGFLASLVVLLKPQIYAPGDFIIREGEIGKEMFFLSKGVVEVQAGSFRKKLDSGSIFGEIAVLFLGKRTASIVAVTYCDVYVLQKDDLDGLLPYYPEQEETIREVAAERYARTHSKDDKKPETPATPTKSTTTTGNAAPGASPASAPSPNGAGTGTGSGAGGQGDSSTGMKRKPSFANVARMLVRTKSVFGQKLAEARERKRKSQTDLNSSAHSNIDLPGAVPVMEREISAGDLQELDIQFEQQYVVKAGDMANVHGMAISDLVAFKAALSDVLMEVDAALISSVVGQQDDSPGIVRAASTRDSPTLSRHAAGASELHSIAKKGSLSRSTGDSSLALAEKGKASPQKTGAPALARASAPPASSTKTNGVPPLSSSANGGGPGGAGLVSPRAEVAADLPKSLPPITGTASNGSPAPKTGSAAALPPVNQR